MKTVRYRTISTYFLKRFEYNIIILRQVLQSTDINRLKNQLYH